MSRISLIFYFFYILSFYFKLLFHSAVKKTCQYISSLTSLYRRPVRQGRAETHQRPHDVLPEAGAPGRQRVGRHPAQVRADTPADNERGEGQ